MRICLTRFRRAMVLVVAVALPILPGEGAWADPIAFDANSLRTVCGSAAADLSVITGVSVGSQADRVLVVTVGAEENDGDCNLGLASATATYGGLYMSKAITTVSGTTSWRACNGIFYLMEPAVGTADVVIQFPTITSQAIDNRHAGAFVLYNVAQAAPESIASVGANAKTNPKNTLISTLTPGAWVVDVFTQGNAGGTFTTTQAGQIERWERSCTSSGSATSTKEVATPGLTSLGWNHSKPLRYAHSLAAFAPATATVCGDWHCDPGETPTNCAHDCGCAATDDGHGCYEGGPAQAPGGCFCDPSCVTLGDCCPDACTACSVCEDPSPSQVLQTGQRSCYDADGAYLDCTGTGQDGELRKGIVRGDRTFIDNGNGTITDVVTGLMWEKLSNDGTIHDVDNEYTWAGAFAIKLAMLNAAYFAGYNDWRVPNSFELFSLVSHGEQSPSTHPVFNMNCQDSCTVLTCSCTATSNYWSSTSNAGYATAAWKIDFSQGYVSDLVKTLSFNVRAVRDGS